MDYLVKLLIALVIVAFVIPKRNAGAEVASDRWDWLVATPQSQGVYPGIL